MVSSALYRYFASRDELLTALIIEAYDDLGEVAERSITKSRADAPLARWVEAGTAIRRWALEHPRTTRCCTGRRYPAMQHRPTPSCPAPGSRGR